MSSSVIAGTTEPAGKDRSTVKPASSLLMTAGGVVAALSVWALLQGAYPLVKSSESVEGGMGPPPPEVQARLAESNRAAEKTNHLIALVFVGACFGGLITAGSLLFRRTAQSVGIGFITAAAIAAIGGALIGLGWRPLTQYLAEEGRFEVMTQSMIFQAVTWGCIGLAVGLGVGLLQRSGVTLRAIAGGILGGSLAGLLYTPLVGTFLPLAVTEESMPASRMEQLVWVGLPGVLIPLLCGLGMQMQLARRTSKVRPEIGTTGQRSS